MVKKLQTESEQLSATLDGEGNDQDILRLLDSIENEPEHRSQLGLYHLIGDALRNPDSPALATDVTARVMRSVAREPVPAIPADATVRPFVRRNRVESLRRPLWRSVGASAAAVAAVAFISALVWRGSAINSDPVVAYVIFEQPVTQPQVVQLDSMPPDMVDYLLAHRQNSAAGSMNAGSALIRASSGDAGSLTAEEGSAQAGGRSAQPSGQPSGQPSARPGNLEWARLWDNRPVYVTTRPVER